MIEVLSPGAWTTIQDEGRYRLSHSGISPAGAADPVSFRLANLLVENPPNSAAIEMTLMGGKFRFLTPVSFAITGGDFEPILDGKSVPLGQTCRAQKGSVLQLLHARRGIRGYLAVSGGIATPTILGSRSPLGTERLQLGDLIPIGPFTEPSLWRTTYSARMSPTETIRFTEGADWELFSLESQVRFVSENFSVSPQSNRQGLRLQESLGENNDLGEQLTEGVCTGTVQVPPSGKPLILMNDQQTTGGYAQIAQIIQADKSVLAQSRPGSILRFQKVTLETAWAEFIALEKELNASLERL